MTPAATAKPRALTLYFIIAIKLGRGLLLLLAALGVRSLADENLTEAFHRLLEFGKADPESVFWKTIEASVARITPANVLWVATGTFLYGIISLVEAVGLFFRLRWAGYMVIAEAAFFIPIEVYKLLLEFSWPLAVILGINILIVWYLYANRQWLFRHHHR